MGFNSGIGIFKLKFQASESIAEAVADAVNSDAFRHESHCTADCFIGDVYLLRSVGDRIHMRFYVVGEMEAKWFQDVTDSRLVPDESLGHVWVLRLNS